MKPTTITIPENAIQQSAEEHLRVARQAQELASEALGELGAQGLATYDDEKEYVLGCQLLLAVKAWQQNLDAAQSEATADLAAALARVRATFAPAASLLADAEGGMKTLVRGYVVAVERRAAALRAKAAKLGPKRKDEADALYRQAEELEAPKVPGISFTPRIRITVLDEEAVPVSFKRVVVDEKALALAIERGDEVPGVRWDDERTVRVTPKNAVKP